MNTRNVVGSGEDTGLESDETWLNQETARSEFCDERLSKRFAMVIKQLCDGTAESIPLACQDWANTKAAYRFFSNARVNEGDILAGHFGSTRDRFNGTSARVLVLHDTTEFSYRRPDIGLLHKPKHGPGDRWRHEHPLCGISMHSSLVVTEAGLPLGLAAVKFWTRRAFKGSNALKRTINPTRVPIGEKESIRWLENLRYATELLGEPGRCVHIGDRQSDIFELFCAARDAGTHFLVRTSVDRRAEGDLTTVQKQMQKTPVMGVHRIEVRDDKGVLSEAVLELKYRRLQVLPPLGKRSRYGPLDLTVIHAQERGRPSGRERINWKLITDLSVCSRSDVIEKLEWYALRWKIEVYHKVLKSGCRVEESRLRSAQRLVNLIATFCILAWRIFWMTMINRSQPAAQPTVALTQMELDLLDRVVADKTPIAPDRRCLSLYITKIAKLGGYLGRTRDPAPGNTVMWRGLSRLTDIALGFSLGSPDVGN